MWVSVRPRPRNAAGGAGQKTNRNSVKGVTDYGSLQDR